MSPDVSPEPSAPAPPGRRLGLPQGVPTGPGVVAALVVAALLLAGLVSWLAVVVHGQHYRTSYRETALAAARQFAVDFSTYDYRHADRDLARLKSEATGTLRTEVAAEQAQVLQLLRKGKATAQGVVRKAAVYDVNKRDVTVLAVVDQTFTNIAVPQGGDPHRYRFVLVMTRVHGHWLVQNFQFV